MKIKDKAELSLLYSNRSICYYNLGKVIFSLSDAFRSLHLDPKNIKAILRLAKSSNDCNYHTMESLCYQSLYEKTQNIEYQEKYVKTKSMIGKTNQHESITTKNAYGNTINYQLPTFCFSTFHFSNTSVSDDPDFFRSLTLNNPLIEIVQIDGYGRGVVAKKNIMKGNIIIYEDALVTATLRTDICDNCLKVPIKPIYSEFKEELYCSKECQNKSWETYFKHLNGRNLLKFKQFLRLNDTQTDSNKMLIIIVKLFAMIQLAEEGSNDVRHVPFLRHLCSYFAEGKVPGSMWEYFIEFKALFKYEDFEAFDFQFYYETFTKVSANLAGINSKYNNHLENAVGLFPTYTFLNHDCDPNATWSTDLETKGNTLEVTALRDIKKGEQIFISYLSNETDKSLRKRRLLQYGITDCSCIKCKV